MNTKQQNRQPRPTWRRYRLMKEWKEELEKLARELATERDQLRRENETLKKMLDIQKMVSDSLRTANRGLAEVNSSNNEAMMRYLSIIGNLTQKPAGRQQAK